MFPLYDDNPHPHRPYVTWLIMGLCVAVFVVQLGLSGQSATKMMYALGFVPALLFEGKILPSDVALVPPWATLFTATFLHGGVMHLAGNMLYLWIFGDNIEVSMGRFRFLVFYLLTGAIAALCHGLLDTGSEIPMIGASGAISGVLGAYVMLFPRANIQVLTFPFGLVGVPAVVVLGIWFGLQLVDGLMSDSSGGGVAFWAHIGGFVAGVVLVPFFKRRSVPLFAARHSRAFAVEKRDFRQGPWGRRPD